MSSVVILSRVDVMSFKKLGSSWDTIGAWAELFPRIPNFFGAGADNVGAEIYETSLVGDDDDTQLLL